MKGSAKRTTHQQKNPRHPVIPPEVNGVLGIFLGFKHRTSGGGPGCLG